MMKQTTHKTILTLVSGVVVFTVLFTQCRKDPNIPFCEQYPNECIEMKHIKDHYYFKTGSWWVYEEQNTGAIDSQWVSSSWLKSNNKEFDMVINSTLDDYDRHRWTHLLTQAKNEDIIPKRKLAYIKRTKGKPGVFIGTSHIGIFYPVVGDSVGNYGGGGYPSETFTGLLRVKNILKEYNLLNNNYTNVIQMFDEYNLSENSQPTIHWYAEGVGLIKKELIDSNQVWLLKKYSVEQ